jgi:5-methyltetrahydrofolate--homocysteine methyltransferase
MEGGLSHSNQKPELNFTEEDWERIERDTMAWWAGELDRPLVGLTAYGPVPTWPPYHYLGNYPLGMPVEEIVDLYEPVFAAARFYGDAFPTWWVNFGPGIMAGFLGARVNSVSDPSETVWFSPLQETSIEDLDLSYDPENVWWKRVKDLTSAIIERWEGRIAVGHTDLGGNLDILASFRETQALLFDLMDQPEKVERLAGRITELWLRYYDELDKLIRPACRGMSCWTPIWSTGKTYMLQCDFSYMISPAMFERFVLPDLTACCNYLDHGFYHLDGKGQIPHLDLLLSISRLRGIQWIPGDGQPPPHEWLPLLKRIRDGGKLCQVFVSPEGARTIVKNLGGKGFLLVVFGGPQFADPEVADGFLKTLAQEDIS